VSADPTYRPVRRPTARTAPHRTAASQLVPPRKGGFFGLRADCAQAPKDGGGMGRDCGVAGRPGHPRLAAGRSVVTARSTP
jgi:hypothetical protein